MMKSVVVCALLSIVLISLSFSTQFIPSSNTNLQFTGRTFTDGTSIYMPWPACYIIGRFTGTGLQLVLSDSSYNTLWTRIDKQEWQAFDDLTHSTVVNLSNNKLSPGKHEFIILKKSEGTIGIKGLLLDDDAKLLNPPPRPLKRIEFIGDSITAGFAVHGEYNARNNDARATWCYVASERLGVEPRMIAVSGIGISHNYGTSTEMNTMPQRYKQISFGILTSRNDFSSWQPNIVVLNLGTNDSSAPTDTTLFENRYEGLLTEIRGYYPKAMILVLQPFGEMFGKNINKVVDLRKQQGDQKIIYVDTKGWLDWKTDWSTGGHPNPLGNLKAADKLAPILQKYL